MAKVIKLSNENPDLTLGFIKDILTELEESYSSDVTEYPFGELRQLLAKCDESAPMPQELIDWDNTPEVGNESDQKLYEALVKLQKKKNEEAGDAVDEALNELKQTTTFFKSRA